MNALDWAKKIAGVTEQPVQESTAVLEEGKKNANPFAGKKAAPFVKKPVDGGKTKGNKVIAKVKKAIKENAQQLTDEQIDALVAEMFDDEEDDNMSPAERELAGKGHMPAEARVALNRAQSKAEQHAVKRVAGERDAAPVTAPVMRHEEDEESAVSRAAAAARMSQAGADAAKSIKSESLALYRRVGGVEETLDPNADVYLVIENLSGRVECCFPDVVAARKFVNDLKSAAPAFKGYSIEPRQWARPAHFIGKNGF